MPCRRGSAGCCSTPTLGPADHHHRSTRSSARATARQADVPQQRAPVLAGQRLEVREPEMPSAEEQADP